MPNSATIACNVCGASLAPRYPTVLDPQTREHFSIDACVRCGLGHTVPQPADLSRYYGATYHGGRHGFTAAYCSRRRTRLIEQVAGKAKGRRLLDVGCGDGTFLLAAKARGWAVTGTEMNPAIARGAGLDVGETLEEITERGPFDCITYWHCLEHLRDPHASVEAASKLLSPGGKLVVAVPDAQGLQARLFGAGWFHLDVPRHLFHFGDRSLTKLFEGVGLEVVGRWHQELEYDLFGWSQSALNAIMPSPNTFFYKLTGRTVAEGAGQVAANFVLGSAFTALALPAVSAGTVAGSGGTLIMAGSRPG